MQETWSHRRTKHLRHWSPMSKHIWSQMQTNWPSKKCMPCITEPIQYSTRRYCLAFFFVSLKFLAYDSNYPGAIEAIWSCSSIKLHVNIELTKVRIMLGNNTENNIEHIQVLQHSVELCELYFNVDLCRAATSNGQNFKLLCVIERGNERCYPDAHECIWKENFIMRIRQ